MGFRKTLFPARRYSTRERLQTTKYPRFETPTTGIGRHALRTQFARSRHWILSGTTRSHCGTGRPLTTHRLGDAHCSRPCQCLGHVSTGCRRSFGGCPNNSLRYSTFGTGMLDWLCRTTRWRESLWVYYRSSYFQCLDGIGSGQGVVHGCVAYLAALCAGVLDYRGVQSSSYGKE